MICVYLRHDQSEDDSFLLMNHPSGNELYYLVIRYNYAFVVIDGVLLAPHGLLCREVFGYIFVAIYIFVCLELLSDILGYSTNDFDNRICNK